MSEEKLSSDEVPGKFTEWLLAMGCQAEKVPPIATISEMCRGQYYMVWRSLMEQVDAKDVVRNKRLQVFCDDIRKCETKIVYREQGSKTIVPDQLSLWKEQTELRQKVEDAKTRVVLARRNLHQLIDKNNSKSQRELSRRSVSHAARRAWFLRQVAASLQQKTADLKKTQAIADSLCSLDCDDSDFQSKLDKCICLFRRQHTAPAASLSTSNTSVVSTGGDNDLEEHIWSVVRCGGQALCTTLYERRANLLRALTTPPESTRAHSNKVTPQSVLSHTAALHCSLALEATKSKLHLQQARKRLVTPITELNNYLSGESCELLVLRCEKASVEARVTALRGLLDELQSNSGTFRVHREDGAPTNRSVAAVDSTIEIKKEELKRTIAQLNSVELKIQNTRECLATILGAFVEDSAPRLNNFRGIQLELPSESISELREFYGNRRRRLKINNVSLELDISNGSFSDVIDYTNPRFVDELRIYLKKFNLDNNRQFVLDNGEKIYVFETIESSIERLHRKWLQEEISCNLLSPMDSLTNNLKRLTDCVRMRADLENLVKELKCEGRAMEIDIEPYKREEEELTDRTKKRLQECLTELQKIAKTFANSQENLNLWSENKVTKYIAFSRTVDGISYRDYEQYYLENCFSV